MAAAAGARLAAIPALLAPEPPLVVDVGCDHGRLADLLGDRFRWLGCDLIHNPDLGDRRPFFRGDGCAALVADCPCQLVLAGMGEPRLGGLLARVPQGARRVVCVPSGPVSDWRERMAQAGWRVVAEDLLRDAGRWYRLVAYERGVEPCRDQDRLRIGPLLLAEQHPALGAWAVDLRRRQAAAWRRRHDLTTPLGAFLRAVDRLIPVD